MFALNAMPPLLYHVIDLKSIVKGKLFIFVFFAFLNDIEYHRPQNNERKPRKNMCKHVRICSEHLVRIAHDIRTHPDRQRCQSARDHGQAYPQNQHRHSRYHRAFIYRFFQNSPPFSLLCIIIPPPQKFKVCIKKRSFLNLLRSGLIIQDFPRKL